MVRYRQGGSKSLPIHVHHLFVHTCRTILTEKISFANKKHGIQSITVSDIGERKNYYGVQHTANSVDFVDQLNH
jgi:hypothetical protein